MKLHYETMCFLLKMLVEKAGLYIFLNISLTKEFYVMLQYEFVIVYCDVGGASAVALWSFQHVCTACHTLVCTQSWLKKLSES